MAEDTMSNMREILELFGVKESGLKPEQQTILDCLLRKKDCMAILPTGFGKSLPYQMLPLLQKKTHSTIGKILICSPLVSLMEDQVTKLRKIPGYSVAFRGSCSEDDSLIESGDVNVIFASPESLVGDKHWRSVIGKLPVSTIVVDEFHTVVTWGGLDDEGSTFREWFGHLGELRSMFPTASLLALSATCPKDVRKKVMKTLNMDVEMTTILAMSPNKPNIKFMVKKADSKIEVAMIWLVDSLSSLKENFPRTIIYANSIKVQSDLYMYLCTEVENCDRYVEMFHSETPEEKKKDIIEKLQGSNNLRVVIATSALGMGVDVTNCNNVILYGPPKSFIDMLQEVGRVGRDGSHSLAVLMFNSFQLKNCGSDMKNLYVTKNCRRRAIMGHFLSKTEMAGVDYGTHICCDVCEELCKCGNCIKTQLQQLMLDDKEPDEEDSDESSGTISYEYESDTMPSTDDCL